MKDFRTFLARWFPVIVSMGIIFLISADHNPYRWLPARWFDSSPAGGISTEDVGHLGHFLEYALLGFTVLRAVVWQQDLSLKLILFSVVFCVVYAISDEFHQLFVPGREFQAQDLLVDGGGMLVGIFLQYLRVGRDSPINWH